MACRRCYVRAGLFSCARKRSDAPSQLVADYARVAEMENRAYFVTGTDTGVGKTTVTCALAAALREWGLSVGVAKPVETGCLLGPDGNPVPADAELLRYFSGCKEPLSAICPYRAAEPLAPSVALRREARGVDLGALGAIISDIVSRHTVTFIEGAGGVLVPVSGTVTFADLALEWGLPLIVVVANRLGALNHAQLTIGWAKKAGLRVAGYIVNAVSRTNDLASRTNLETLAELLGPPLGVMPWLGPVRRSPEDRARLAGAARQHVDLLQLIAR